LRVSFIIPLYNCLPLTQAMLASLRATVPGGLANEIIFVDDGSTDGTREWLRQFEVDEASSLVRHSTTLEASSTFRVVLNERNLGYAAANNRAIALARGEFLVLLNNDLVLLPRWLEPLLAAHRALGARAGLIGNVQLELKSGAVDHAGIVINRQGKPVHARALPPWWSGSRVFSGVRRVPAVTGACLLIDRALWRQLGGFDERYVNGGEDIDLCFRARANGRINAVALRSVVRHHVSASPGRKLRDEENSFRLARRWGREIIAAADHATRDWCREYLASILPKPHWRQYPLACRALLHATHLRTTPPAEAVAAIEREFAKELVHWEEMFARRGAPTPRRVEGNAP